MPEIAEMKGELKNLNTGIDALGSRIDSLDSKIDSARNEIKTDIARVESDVDDMDKRLSGKIDDLDKRLDIVQRLSVVEVKIREKEEESRPNFYRPLPAEEN